MTSVEHLPIPRLELGEGPHWLADQGALLLVDVFGKALCIYDPKTKALKTLKIDDPQPYPNRVSMAVPLQDHPDLYIVGVGRTLALVRWSQCREDVPVRATVLHTTNDHHFNDAKCDSRGRLWVGTMTSLDESGTPSGSEDSALYRLDSNLTITKMVDKVTISNGMAWTEDLKLFYYVDSTPALVYCYDYDEEAGTICNERVVFDYKSAGLMGQVPDGMTIDTDGRLWIACFGGAQVIQVDPSKQTLLRSIPVPSPNVTSVAFGGPQLDVLFVTSGTLRLEVDAVLRYPQAGGTFAVHGTGARGFLPGKFTLDAGKLKEVLKE